MSAVIIRDVIDTKVLQDYKKKYLDLPKVIIFNEHIFFIALNIASTGPSGHEVSYYGFRKK